ncbi:hypothetical protein N559_2682 [Klebsiella pneumoniae JM45]|nr:hypothetical protein N559_2682 [Klebsiella pneumoniae JM45]
MIEYNQFKIFIDYKVRRMNDRNNRVLVLADDFTGANDAGVSLAEAGMSVEVAFTAGQPSTARALISTATAGR